MTLTFKNRNTYKITRALFALFLMLFFQSCLNDKMKEPNVQDSVGPGVNDVQYVLIKPILDANNGFQFNKPSDIYVGADNFVYVCDTGNDRIVMLDAGGQVQGYSNTILHPEAITQNDSLQLLIVNNTNAIYRIDMHKYNHDIGLAPVEQVFIRESIPTLQYTGITVHNHYEYYVTAINTADTAAIRNASFIYDFNSNNTLRGPLPLNSEGSGLFTALIPTSIVSLRERYLDLSATQEITPAFLFTQKAKTSLYENFFKVQHVTTAISEGDIIIVPNTSYIGKDIYNSDLVYLPEDIAIDKSGFIYVVDKGNASHPPAFFRFSSSGDVMQKFSGDGNNLDDIILNGPKGIAVQLDNEDQILYIADTGNDRVLLFKRSDDLD